jgi:release factor glutamine methyltransferase
LNPRDAALLAEAAAGSSQRLAELSARVAAGEPAAYAAGFLRFRDRRFAIDPRAYVTDPELTDLVDAVAAEGLAFAAARARPPVILEFGVGAGTLAISLQLEHPEWTILGLDVDEAALDVARINVAQHGVAVRLLQSDMLDGWPADLPAPDIVFGDPPWGGETDLYADDRDAEYYHRMPPKSAYSGGDNPCALHDRLLAALRERHWPTRVVLNYGVLAAETIDRSTRLLHERQIRHPAPGLTIVSGMLSF